MKLAANPADMPVDCRMERQIDQTAHRKATLIVAACASWAGFALVAWWQASGASSGFDQAGLLFWREGPSLLPPGPGWLTNLMQGLTVMGGGTFRTVLGVAVLAALLVRRHTRQGLVLLAIVLPAAAINSGLKALFARPRPDLVPYLDSFGAFSFPSGHSFNGTATYLGLALVFASLAPRLRPPLLAAGLTLSLGIAFSRVWLGVHYPTDAIAGLLAGAGWVLLVWALLQPEGE